MSLIIIYYSLFILVLPKPYSIGKYLNNLNMINKDKVNKMNDRFKRNLNDDNFMILYFNQDCQYSSGFGLESTYRNDVDFIINGNIKIIKFAKNESFSVTKGIGIEIHFNKAINSLFRFFDRREDKNMEYLTFVDFTNFNSISVSNMGFMFYECYSLENIDLSNFDTSQVTDMGWMFSVCYSLESIDLSNFNTSQVIDMGWMFYNCNSLKSIDLSNFNTSQVIDMGRMFYNCNSLKSIDLSNFNTSQVIDMGRMFCNCNSLKSIDLSNFNTSQVTDMGRMFCNCNSLKSIDLSNFNTSQVTDMDSMFFNCSSLESINLSNFNTFQVTDMGWMFWNCNSLKSIDLSSFNTFKVINMNYIFYGCNSLISIDLSNFDMFNCYSYNNMFSDISNITYINLYNFKKDKIISRTFNNTSNPIFVCQKDKIIDNEKAYNCCNSDLKVYDCITPKTNIPPTTNIPKTNNIVPPTTNIPKPNNIIPPTTNIPITNNIIPQTTNIPKTDIIIPLDIDKTDSSNNDFTSNITKSSSSISIGAIIGIIAGGIVFILGVIIIICYKCGFSCKNCISRLKQSSSNPTTSPINQTQNTTIAHLTNNNTNESKIIRHKPESDIDNPILVIFQNQGVGDFQILIDYNESIDELIRFYFEINGRSDLYGDQSIRFLRGGECFTPPYPKKLVGTLVNKIVKSKTIKICVDDNDDKMKK